MVQLTIHFGLLPDKLNEFILSWERFCQHIQKEEGIYDYSLNHSKENKCEIILLMKDQQSMNDFMQDYWYKFLDGAIDVLGENKNILQKQIQHNN